MPLEVWPRRAPSLRPSLPVFVPVKSCLSDDLPAIPVSLQNVRQKSLHVFTIDCSLGSHMQVPPIKQLQYIQQRDSTESEWAFFQAGVGFFEKYQAQGALGLSYSALHLETLLELMGVFVHGLHGKVLQHLGHQAIARIVRLVLQSFPSYSKDSMI